ncbi:hypothetical protein ABEB36_005101 [Hypothenemus hampei]|uniref:KIF-binding protein n=1 Tax=Hypothenemus hampei TaxID=57062 RepID=A0ABD1EWZ3_HYPHA
MAVGFFSILIFLHRYHLTVAENILNPLEVALLPNPEVHMAQADLARSWIHYGLQLFEASRNQKISKSIEDDIENEIRSNEKLPSNSEILEFSGLNVEIPTNVPDTPIHNLEQAKQLFSHLQKMIKRARLYYTLRDYPLEYVNLCLDLSELYRFLAFYEEDLDSQYAVQKRRYDALETLSNILKEVRPNCYIAVNVELIKELIEVQIELMNLNLKKFYSPSQVPKNDINDGVLKRHIKAFSVIHNKLQNVTSVLNTSTSSEQIKGLKFKEPNLEKLVDEEKVKN